MLTFSTCNYADQIKPVGPTYTGRNIVHGCLLKNFLFIQPTLLQEAVAAIAKGEFRNKVY